MKALLKIHLILLILIVSGCNEDDNDISVSDLNGEWFYRSDRTQSLDFSEPGVINVNGNPYIYEVLDNSELELSYSGPLFILLPKTRHEINLGDEGTILQITNLENLHFFTHDPGEEAFER